MINGIEHTLKIGVFAAKPQKQNYSKESKMFVDLKKAC